LSAHNNYSGDIDIFFEKEKKKKGKLSASKTIKSKSILESYFNLNKPIRANWGKFEGVKLTVYK